MNSCAFFILAILLGSREAQLVGAFQHPAKFDKNTNKQLARRRTYAFVATLQEFEPDLLSLVDSPTQLQHFDANVLPPRPSTPISPDAAVLPREGQEEVKLPSLEGASTTTTTTAAGHSSQKRKSPSLSTWKRRLVTKEDKKNIHKYSALGFVLSSAVLVGTGAMSGFTNAPDFLGPVTVPFVCSTLVQSTSSIEMALNHRKNDIATRNGFVAASISSAFTAMIALWVSPFAPDVFNMPYVSEAIMGPIALTGLLGDIDCVIHASDILESRSRKKTRGSQDETSVAEDFLGYIFPVFWGIPLYTIFICRIVEFMNNVGGARAGFLASCLHDGDMMSNQIPIFYAMVITTCSVSYGSLAVTLRDKKLITKNQEQAIVGILSLLAAASSVHANGWI